jgi:hypothetical protein
MTGTLTLDLGLEQPRTRGERDRRGPRERGSATAVQRPLAAGPAPQPIAAPAAVAPHALAPGAGAASQSARSLDDLISAAWEDLVAHHTVACPVCTGPMAPRYGSGARPVGGRCRRCGSTLG